MNSTIGLWTRIKSPLFLSILSALVFSACNPTAPAPTRTPLPVIVPTAVILIVPPAPTTLPSATPSKPLPPGFANIAGDWTLNLNYRLTGYPLYSDVRYIASLPLTLNPDGSFSGSGTIYTTLVQPPCNAQVSAGNGADVTLGGQIESSATTPIPGSTNVALMADLTLTPQDPAAVQTFQLICSDTTLSDKRDVSILWPALAAAGQLQVRFPFQPGVVLSGIRDVTLPSGRSVPGALAFQVRLGR